MKIIALFAFLSCLALASAACDCPYNHGDGRPGCKTATELTRVYRNNWDPTRFWKCTTLNKPAEKMICPGNQAFSDEDQKCVGWSCWQWTKPCDPPSSP